MIAIPASRSSTSPILKDPPSVLIRLPHPLDPLQGETLQGEPLPLGKEKKGFAPLERPHIFTPFPRLSILMFSCLNSNINISVL